jgi:hypothetical protein
MKRHPSTAAAAVVVLFALGACGHQDPGTGPVGKPPVPAQPVPEQDRTPVPAAQLAPGSPQAWTQDGGSVLVVKGKEGGCSREHPDAVVQDRGQVKVVLVEEQPDPAKICTMDIRYPPFAVRLDEPLDKRQVVVQTHQVKVPNR